LKRQETETLLLDLHQVESNLGISKATIYRLIAAGDFPKPIAVTSKARRWTRASIVDWIASRQAAA
jgi:prophage regulatory protein